MAIIQRNIINKTNGKNETRYSVRVRDPFRQWYPSETFERRCDAERYERALLLKKEKGGAVLAPQQRQMTFAEYWELWASECRNRVSEGWKQTQNQMAKKHILPLLGAKKIREITPQEVGSFLSGIEAQGYSAQQVLHLYNLLHKLFSDAQEYHELVEQNPVRRRFRPQIPRIERAFLTPEESQRLLEGCKDHPIGRAVWIAVLAGLRPGEIQALKWSAVDFDNSQILIRAAFNRKINTLQDHPKQKDWGRAPMPEPLREFLLSQRQSRQPDDWVCPNMQGGMLSYHSFALEFLPRFCQQAGVKRITPHELRHSCTELYVQAGASAEDLRRLLNHKSLSATSRYIHRTDSRLQSIAGRVKW